MQNYEHVELGTEGQAEPKGKLDAMTMQLQRTGQPAGGVLGTASVPEGVALDWPSIDWRHVEDDVRRLRRRIFTTTQTGNLKKVRNLQKWMFRSRANTLVSARRSTGVRPEDFSWAESEAQDPSGKSTN